MDETFIKLVAERLQQAGLIHEVIDPGEVARDLAERTALNQSLDEVVGPSDMTPAPASFNPQWFE